MTLPKSELSICPAYEEYVKEEKLLPVLPLSQPSLEDFMREDKLPPVFPSSQPTIEEYMRDDKLSVISETQVFSYNFISELSDPIWSSPSSSPRQCLSPGPSFDSNASSSLLLSPSPGPSFNSNASSSLLLSPSPGPSFNSNASSSMLLSPSPGPSFNSHANSNSSLGPSPGPSWKSNNSVNSDTIVKLPATRGRKRKLFTDGEQKKIQNKEAARRYREKKKTEDSKLEIEEAELISKQKKMRKEVEILSRTHREVLLMVKYYITEQRKQKREMEIEFNKFLQTLN